MDDLGAEHLSQLSASDKNVKSVDVKSPDSVVGDTAPSPARNLTGNFDARAIFGGGFVEKSNSKPLPAPRGRYKDRAILGSPNYHHNPQLHHHHNELDEEEVSLSSSDGKEKTDATPENVKKIDDVIQVVKSGAPNSTPSAANGSKSNADLKKENYDTKCVIGMASETGMNDEQNNINMASAGAPLLTPNSTIADDDGCDESSASSAKQQCLAFTIDFGESSAKEANSAAAAKYKSMVERFQNRHRRGASMSKLEGGNTAPSSESSTPIIARSPRAPSELPPVAPDSSAKVKMRARDRSTSRVRDASKRHSWSPRSSTAEPQQQQNQNHPKVTVPPKSPTTTTPTTKKPKSKPLPLQMPPQDIRKDKQSAKPFTPRSTAMQMALQKIDFLCPQPPLDDYHHLAMNDNVSEAGTYTLDGDNYTEEQKELMNIDKSAAKRAELSAGKHLQQKRPKDLPLNNTQTPTTTTTLASSQSRRRNNVLEVNYYHDATTTPYKPTNKTSYLEKIKSRVRNIAVKQQQQQQLTETSPPDADVGTFTSVTTSGVLAKQATLDCRPKLTRRSSLSTSQIDSSEYVSTEAKLKSNTAYNGGYTDHQKAGYRLNVFTNQTDSQILNAIESPESPVSKHSDTAVLKTAQTKNDWIQEWARNARARSVASAIKGSPSKQAMQQQQHDIMSRSYNCAGGPGEEDPLTDDSIMYRNKTIDRFRMGDFDYASDPNVSAQRPPKSPTKIPSPMHSIGRARSASHTRASLQSIIQDDPNNTDLYLQKTAAAISNLQQSLSRKNSLKSPPSSRDSPKKVPARHHHTTTHQYYSADEYSPQHSIEAKLLLSNSMHKRTASNLMTNSYHEQNVMDVKIPRARKNSYDAQALTVSPARRHQTLASKQQQYYGSNIDQTRTVDSSIKQQQQSMSPLRRSSSFSAKCKTTTNNNSQHKRPTATLYTPPAARHNYMAPPVGTSAIKKSASSSTFRHVYSDYDDNMAYYINDEDDLIDVEYYGSSDEDIHSTNVDEDYEDYNDDVSQHVVSESVQSPEVPLSNTRYNKALLMRIERSKQKVAGNTSGGGGNQQMAKQNLLAGGGMVACPNTPELPRRTVKSAPRSSMRQSMPRDSSLNRLAGHIPNSLASAKKQILQTANAVAPSNNSNTSGGQQKRVQPKYMDISKYKPAQGNNFLRKNDSKSTLKPEIRRSPSSASMGLSRTEPTRTSNRSVKSATSGRGTSAARRDASVTKQKEVELAMWKRRATYDPMRAAAEDRRKKEEAKKSAQGGVAESATVTRSQSFHYGVGSLSGNTQSSASNQQSLENRWTLTSNESSDEEHAYISSSTNRS